MATSAVKTKGLLQQFVRRCHSDMARTKCISTKSVTKVISKQPVVLATEGKWVQLEGVPKPLVNFASSDVFGIQNHPLLNTVENETNIVRKHTPVQPNTDHTISVQRYLQNSLSSLHGKDDAIMTSESFDVTLNCWLRHMFESGYVAHVPADCSLVEGDSSNVRRYSTINDLKQQLREEKEKYPAHRSLVFVETAGTMRSVQHLKELCHTVEKQFATVVLLDPEGLIMSRHAIGELQDTLKILRRPAIIQSTLNPVTCTDHVCYVTGTRKHIELCRQSLGKDRQELDEQLAKRIKMGLTLLSQESHRFYTTLLHSTSLKLHLEGARVSVQSNGMCLSVQLERLIARAVYRELRQKGFHVALLTTDDKQAELQFSVSGHHDYHDVTQFQRALIQLLCKYNVIDKEAAAKIKVPKISLAYLDSTSDNPKLQEVTSYDRVVKAERVHRKKNKSEESKLISLSKINGKVDKAEPKLSLNDYDIRWLSEVYCSTDRDPENDWRDTIMWASPLDTDDVTISDSNQVPNTQSEAAPSDERTVAVGGDIRYLEDVYCNPMFDEQFTQNLRKQQLIDLSI